jgi:hypothetical protein
LKKGVDPYNYETLETAVRRIYAECVRKPQYASTYTIFCLKVYHKLGEIGFCLDETGKYVSTSYEDATSANMKWRGFREILVELLRTNFYSENKEQGLIR